MGILERLKGGVQFNKIAKSVGFVIELLDAYEFEQNEKMLLEAAWLCRAGILDKLEEYHYSMTSKIYVTVRGYQQRMILNEALIKTLGRLSAKANNSPDFLQEKVNEILEKQQAFYDVDKHISYESKNKYI